MTYRTLNMTNLRRALTATALTLGFMTTSLTTLALVGRDF